ncbi:uncharacterized protein B0I36DRAFT_316105 [Microdochium trichocladiopsis]|uniref:DUF676 domain-containing protein n=1 Tax=Microdochium trichocladiopsis TaxID=1682393 RepID=A0A9P9BYV1_9PEZI|nr:uncharacterized protein B0I36DRAFT_316105 [Microdochium trichocladiopsis]KAH7038398.1 hypothetical protein B0I36DRAFT_316105 [Microdochium trichocladiopsis]
MHGIALPGYNSEPGRPQGYMSPYWFVPVSLTRSPFSPDSSLLHCTRESNRISSTYLVPYFASRHMRTTHGPSALLLNHGHTQSQYMAHSRARSALRRGLLSDCDVHSLAIEHHGRSQTATISLTNGASAVPERLGPCAEHVGQHGNPALDSQFLGLTTLFAPPISDHKIDIVAISGLGGYVFGLFKERGGEHMWLRDALPYYIVDPETGRPMARIVIYGYLSPVADSDSMQNVDDIAGQFREQLSGLVVVALGGDPSPRPVVFISHSLGGLVLKETIISLAASDDDVAARVRRAIYGLIFFGVPHAGMDNTSLMTMAREGPNRELVLSIGHTNS